MANDDDINTCPPYRGTYSEFHDFNRFQNLDGIEWKIISHLMYSETKYAQDFWRILAHNEINALSFSVPSLEERMNLVRSDNNYEELDDETEKKRLFMQPFVDDAWSEQCSSVYVYVDKVTPMDATRANIVVVVEAVVHAKISVVTVPNEAETPNPNDFDEQGNIVVTHKNRATVLLKSILAELNGLYLDGIGYLQLDQKTDKESKVSLSLWNSRSYYGYTIKFGMVLSGVSGNADEGF